MVTRRAKSCQTFRPSFPLANQPSSLSLSRDPDSVRCMLLRTPDRNLDNAHAQKSARHYTSYGTLPRPLPKEGRGPGTHCLRMRENTPGFYGSSYNSVPYRRLYPWTVRDRPFYCLGVALRICASFLPLSPTLFLKLEKKDWC